MTRFNVLVLAAFIFAMAAPCFAGPFSDVPAGHWSYKAIEKAVEAGILQGYDGKFHGNKTLNRYQMAVVVARMLDRIETMGPGKVSKKDIENLEALTIEFADELALLNVKVSTLEDGFAELKKDVDVLKKDYASGGAKAGISGLMQTRYVMTDDDNDFTSNRGLLASFASGGDLFANAAGTAVAAGAYSVPGVNAAGNMTLDGVAVAPAVAAIGTGGYSVYGTPTAVPAMNTVAAGALPAGAGNQRLATRLAGTSPLGRYVATGNVFNAANGNTSYNRSFFDVSQASLAIDRHFDEDFYLHMQLDVDATTEAFGKSIQINEAYVDMEKLIADGDMRIRVGSWALPFSRERNPEMVEYPNQLRYGFRTLDLTVTPSYMDQVWERVRNTGLALWNGKDCKFQWQVGVGNTANAGQGFVSNGTLLARPMGQALGFGDQLNWVDSQGAQAEDYLGFYLWAGDKYNSGWRWDVGYYANNGDLAPTNAVATNEDWSAFQVNVGYWGWENWGFMGSYYNGTSKSAGDATGTFILGAGADFMYPILRSNVYPDVESESFSLLANYKFNDKNNVTARYEDLSDQFGLAEYSARAFTLGWNHKVSQNSLLQLEYVSPESDETQAVLGTGIAAGGNGVALNTIGAIKNTNDVNDDLFILNYKVKF